MLWAGVSNHHRVLKLDGLSLPIMHHAYYCSSMTWIAHQMTPSWESTSATWGPNSQRQRRQCQVKYESTYYLSAYCITAETKKLTCTVLGPFGSVSIPLVWHDTWTQDWLVTWQGCMHASWRQSALKSYADRKGVYQRPSHRYWLIVG